jgi:S-adenosyl-L-methionine hydrolase (adenosine-forming)
MLRRLRIVTFLSDFGMCDAYAASMKAAVLKVCPDAKLIDITHHVPRHDVQCGSITLERAIDGFLPGSVHVAVVDPGVGTRRRILVVEIAKQIVVCPDNGLITWAWRRHPGGKAHELIWRPARASDVFHGRDIMAPAAARIAGGAAIVTLARAINDPVLLDVAPSEMPTRGHVIHIDHFGNATTNLVYDRLRQISVKAVRTRGKSVGALKRTYHDVAPGKPLALIGSSGLLEIAVRDGSAAQQLKIKVGDEVTIK